MKLFSGQSSKHSATSLSNKLNLPLANYELVKFGDSEIKPVVKEEVRGETCVILLSTANPVNDSYMELFLLADALKRGAAERIIAVTPYFGYARQNQQHMSGEPVSAHVMVKFIETVGVDELITVDLHEEQIGGFFSIPLTHISALPLLAQTIGEEIISRHVGDNKPSIIVISPDQGGVERTRKFRNTLADFVETRHASSLQVDQEIGIVEKLRNLEGQHETKLVEVTGNVEGKIAIIPDDVIVSGGTILHAAEAIKNKGATAVYLGATHADFIEGTVETLKNAPVEKIFITDTIEIKDKWKFERLEVVSVAELLTEEIKKYL